MELNLLDCALRLGKSFRGRVFGSVASSVRHYDSLFDRPDIEWKSGRALAWPDARGEQEVRPSLGGISVLSGSPVTTWSTLPVIPCGQTEYDLRLALDSPVIVGRSVGCSPEYLDPAYRPTTIVPGTGQAVLRSDGDGKDRWVSRAHFMLLGGSRGIVFVNGVPRKGGGIRPPLNGTRLLAPKERVLSPGEHYSIEAGTGMVVRLPNGTELRIDAK